MKSLVLLMCIGLIAQNCIAIINPVGYWSGTWEDDDGATGTHDLTLNSNNTVTGQIVEPGFINFPHSGTYTFNPTTSFFDVDISGTSTADGYPVRYWALI